MGDLLRRDGGSVFRVAFDLEVSGKRKRVSGRGEREGCFEEGGYSELSDAARWGAENCRKSGVNPGNSIKGTNPDKTE